MITTTGGRIIYEVVGKAMEELGIARSENDGFSVLIWNDTIKDMDYFNGMMPWQVVNRLPLINIICRKAPFVRSIQRLFKYFPQNVFSFLPRSYILPIERERFGQQLKKQQKVYIVKPDNGALGQGIVIVKPGDEYVMTNQLSVAQEYIESYLLDGYKFDLRIYCLVIAGSKPEIYVYHDGIARFCSQPAEMQTAFSQLTNTAVNIKNPSVTAEGITKIVSDVFQQLKAKGIDIEKLWEDIEEAMALTVLSASSFINNGSHLQCPMIGYPRCFQLLGFDVLLSQKMKPYILEVNYRPSLEAGTFAERNLKIRMLKELVSLAAPYGLAETAIRNQDKRMTQEQWTRFLVSHPEIVKDAENKKEYAKSKSTFVQVFPNPKQKNELWNEIYQTSSNLSSETRTVYHLPCNIPTFTPITTPSMIQTPKKVFTTEKPPIIRPRVKPRTFRNAFVC